MHSQNNEPQNLNILGGIAGLIGIISIFIYFTGWVYRWAYFSFFELDMNSISFPVESFFIVPIQVFLGSLDKIILSIVVITVTFLSIKITIFLLTNESNLHYDHHKTMSPLLITRLQVYFSKLIDKLPSGVYQKKLQIFIKHNILLSIFTKKLHRFYLFKLLRSFTQVFPQSLRNEIAIVAWVLSALFWFAQYQGHADAFRDAVNQTSTRPIITLVTKKENLAIGRELGNENELENLKKIPSLKNFRIVGDIKQFYQIWGKETNLNQSIVWRLLLQTDKWVYLFPALPSSAKPNQRPPLLAINAEQSQIQMLILSRPK